MIFDTLKFLFICVEVILIFNLMILVHELGHFLAARWRGLVVEKFAIWFGKPIWKKTIGGVEYRLGCIPAGGFVAIPQLAPMEVMEGSVETDRAKLPPVKPLDKIIVAFAGPLFSFLLAFVFAVMVWVLGRPVSEAELSTTVGMVIPDGPAAKAGLKAGDKILSIDGVPVTQFSPAGNARGSIIWNIASSEEPQITIEVERDGATKTVQVDPIVPDRAGWGRKNLRQIGMIPAMTPRIASVIPDSPAAVAGLQSGDAVVSANGEPLRSMPRLSEILKETGGAPVTLAILRGDQTLDFTIKPEVPAQGETAPMLGVRWDLEGTITRAHPTPFQQISSGMTMIVDTIAAVASPKSEIGLQHLSGPVGIMNAYYRLFEREDGWLLALWFSVILNVNLALLNLLPIPVLDGGHIVLAIIESLLGKPVNVRILEFVQTGFALLLIGFLLYVTFFDILDVPGQAEPKVPPEDEVRFTPKPITSSGPPTAP